MLEQQWSNSSPEVLRILTRVQCQPCSPFQRDLLLYPAAFQRYVTPVMGLDQLLLECLKLSLTMLHQYKGLRSVISKCFVMNCTERSSVRELLQDPYMQQVGATLHCCGNQGGATGPIADSASEGAAEAKAASSPSGSAMTPSQLMLNIQQKMLELQIQMAKVSDQQANQGGRKSFICYGLRPLCVFCLDLLLFLSLSILNADILISILLQPEEERGMVFPLQLIFEA